MTPDNENQNREDDRVFRLQIERLQQDVSKLGEILRVELREIKQLLDERLSGRDTRLDNHDQRFDNHSTRLTRLESFMSAIEREDIPNRVSRNEVLIRVGIFVFSLVGGAAVATLWGIPFGGIS